MEEKTKQYILKLARRAIETYVRTGRIISRPKDYPKELDEKRGVFVTINKIFYGKPELRGCIGLPYPTKPLIDGIIEAAVSATRDPRFPPLAEDELDKIKIEVSILTEPKKIGGSVREAVDKIVPFKHGVIIKKGFRSALFLPQVWDELPKKEVFLSQLCLKAGLPADEWKREGIEFYVFEAEIIEEQ
jgi:AmmeMemoRadiSam system protein A